MLEADVTTLQRGKEDIAIKAKPDGSQERAIVDLVLDQDGQGRLEYAEEVIGTDARR